MRPWGPEDLSSGGEDESRGPPCGCDHPAVGPSSSGGLGPALLLHMQAGPQGAPPGGAHALLIAGQIQPTHRPVDRVGRTVKT